MYPYAAIMFAAGLGIPVLAALNAALGARLGSPALAAFVLFIVALLATAPFAWLSGARPVSLLMTSPRHLLLGGAFVAFYILSVTHLAPKMGVGNAIFFVLIGQMLGATLIDHFGLFGANPSPLNARRAIGLLLMMSGVWMTQRNGW